MNLPQVVSRVDFGVTTDEGETFGLSVFLRDGDSVFRTYFTSGRGVEALGSNWTFLDLTPLGRQEDWEHSPEGWPQSLPYEWWRRHDEYEDAGTGRPHEIRRGDEMSKRNRYQTGVPCWVATVQSDPVKVVGSREPCRLLSPPGRGR
jgi:hypothetical protein